MTYDASECPGGEALRRPLGRPPGLCATGILGGTTYRAESRLINTQVGADLNLDAHVAACRDRPDGTSILTLSGRTELPLGVTASACAPVYERNCRLTIHDMTPSTPTRTASCSTRSRLAPTAARGLTASRSRTTEDTPGHGVLSSSRWTCGLVIAPVPTRTHARYLL